MADNPLWKYSLTVYQLPAVKEDCLKLQDEYGADVNLLLCACWLAQRALACELDDWQLMREISVTFQGQYLHPLRALRRKLKATAPDTVYERAKSLELALEQWQQEALWDYWGERSTPRDKRSFAELAIHNCCGYFQRGDYHVSEDLAAALQQLVASVELAQGISGS